MVVHSEKRLLWHPCSGNKFIVGGGSTITLYEWASDSSEIEHITSQNDLSLMKCFTWSPDPAVEDLIAVGLSTGTVDLMRLQSTKHASNHILSSGPRVSLPVRNSRPCNALAFCSAQPNYLAVGLDKVRNDPSLVIWDIQTARSTLKIDPTFHSTLNGDPANTRSQLQIPRFDNTNRADVRILQQHASTHSISSVTFLPHSAYLLLAGMSQKWLCLFDVRSPVPSATNIASKVHGIATDPTDPHRIGTFGDGVVSIWDSRRISHPLLTFTTKDASADGERTRTGTAFSMMEFSSTRRGTLATLEKDSAHVRFWDLQHAQVMETPAGAEPTSQPNRTPRLSWASPSSMLSWSSSSGSPTAPEEHHKRPSNVVLADTRKTKDFSRSLSSFALVPSPRKHPLASNVMVVNRDGDLELYAIHDTPKYTSWSSRGDLSIGCGKLNRTIPGFDVREQDNRREPWEVQMAQPVPVHALGSAGEDEAVQAYLRGGKRKSTTPAPALFGRGDEDGFPALAATPSGSKERSNLTASKARKNGYAASPTPSRKLNLAPDHLPTKSSNVPASSVLLLSRVYGDGSSVEYLHPGDNREKSRDKSVSRGRKHNIHNLVENDISMVMRRRVLRGYSLTNAFHNHIITQNELMDSNTLSEYPTDSNTLSELWAWIQHAKDVLSSPACKLLGYEFSYLGLLGVWDATPKIIPPSTPEDTYSTLQSGLMPGVVSPTLSTLGLEPMHRTISQRSKHVKGRSHNTGDPPIAFSAGRGPDGSSGKSSVQTAKWEQRQLALQLCGWQLKEEDFANELKKWEKEGKHSKAACWLVFTGQYSKALEVLMRSRDETHHMMSGTLIALIPHGSTSSTRNTELREHTEHLIIRLQDPYFRAMLTHLSFRDWSEVLEEQALPLRERLVVAFQFLDDKALSSYLRRTADRAISDGDIEGIVITGLTTAGMDILQNYVDSTGDVQTAAILSSYVCPSKLQDKRAGRWLDAYRDMLDGWKLFHHRCQLDIDRGEIMKTAIETGDMRPGYEWVPKQIMIRCNYCSKPINMSDPSATYKGRTTGCPHCNRPLPRCSICLMTLAIVPDSLREAELGRSHHQDTFDDALVICQTCRHGGHASHILEWFYGEDGACSHSTCPVADCDCRCADEF